MAMVRSAGPHACIYFSIIEQLKLIETLVHFSLFLSLSLSVCVCVCVCVCMQEVIMTLEVCHKDFEALIRKIQLFGQSDLESKYVIIFLT